MQPIHRTSCQGLPPLPTLCLADHLAVLIDGQTRAGGVAASGGEAAAPAGPPGNALIWVEGEPGLAAGHCRGMIVVGHGPDLAAAERSSVISYPLGTTDKRQCLRVVSNALEKIGWSVVAFRHRKAATGCADIAVLVNQARSGGERRLTLAQPVHAPQQPAMPMAQQRGHVASRALLGQLGMRVDDGATGRGATG